MLPRLKHYGRGISERQLHQKELAREYTQTIDCRNVKLPYVPPCECYLILY
jgi:hypothetical protein